ncbi:MBL fold metallo-hydrolase [Luteimicrobium xylanilyticum]|uniref:Hydroxyacylglutathione hydrolase n=1 Tax=Luteimicrobium xylanilyticum TaxID=1133546 RepID=A0A5P9QGU7_9MICO|nr:MBL fold metallo-hydrolase [Luteimicrobium xylanilyticum]QFU99685.1 Hydroxyacylglutathione hydrolase [Luteimicrobium xylanilyticum]
MTAAPTPSATLVRADNPGPMTLDGTNTWVLRAPGARACLVVDPGPDDAAHLARVAEVALGDGRGWVAGVVVTHRHADHTAGAALFAGAVGAPLRAVLPELCSPDAEPLRDGEVLDVDGLPIGILATPGHTSDSVSLHLPSDRALLTGDTVLGAGSTVLMERDGGDLGDYLASLDRLAAVCATTTTPVVGLPGHGPAIEDLAARVSAYRTHRLERLDEVRAALDTLVLPTATDDAVVSAVVGRVYPDVEVGLLPAATQSVRVQLRYLARGSN